MLSVSTINLKLSSVFFLLLGSLYASAQENSPFSRYGLGDVYPAQNIVSRAMGGVASTYVNPQSINLNNPAAYSELKIVTYDIGITLDTRTLRSALPIKKYNSVDLTPSYVALGVPLSKKRNLGLVFGLKPVTRVNYSIQENKRLPADSLVYLYQGEGGLYQAFAGVGKRWGNLRVGINVGYMFGNKQSTTSTIPVDSVLTYKSNSSTQTTFNHTFANAGLQYDLKLSKTSVLRFGLAGSLKQNLNAQQQKVRETFDYDANGSPTPIDTVYLSQEERGIIKLPASYTAGISYGSNITDQIGNQYEKSLVAIEYETTKWADYRFYGQPDKLINSWQIKAGGQLTPNPLSLKSYWSRATYRAGFFYGKEAVNADGKKLPMFGITLGAGLPIRKWSQYDKQYTIINTAFEIGKRGNKNNNISENFFRVSFGINLSDIWFIKRRYD